jgi:hypothetical protein
VPGGGRRRALSVEVALSDPYTAGALVTRTDPLCAPGHFGPRCEACTAAQFYFDGGACQPCPAVGERLSILGGVSVAVGLAVAAGYWLAGRVRRWGRMVGRIELLVSTLGLQAKFKIIFSFYQMAATMRCAGGWEWVGECGGGRGVGGAAGRVRVVGREGRVGG